MKDRLISIPKIEKNKTGKDKVYQLILKKDMTSAEITRELKINPRMVREAIEHIRNETHIITEKCRCGHTSIYRVK